MKNKLTILIADNHPELLPIDKLHQAGYSIEIATNGKETLRKVEESCPDIILLEYNLPDKNGLEILEKIRKTNIEVTILFFSDFTIKTEEFLEAGAHDFICKKADINEILGRIRNAWIKSQQKWHMKTNKSILSLSSYTSFNSITHELKVKEVIYTLSPTAAEMLKYLTIHIGNPIPKEILGRHIWGYQSDFKEIKTYIYRLRKNLALDTTIEIRTEKNGICLYCSEQYNS